MLFEVFKSRISELDESYEVYLNESKSNIFIRCRKYDHYHVATISNVKTNVFDIKVHHLERIESDSIREEFCELVNKFAKTDLENRF